METGQTKPLDVLQNTYGYDSFRGQTIRLL